jgi:hypothetical protein
MTLRHWLWVAAGLAAWAVLVVLWATGPHDCTVPDDHGRVMCR